ncbi:hypothetical protein [Vallicoccus soli]|uniref:Uncharacterized protein n=1 Tax=Vallicoccus soli TaxID=2339232 RepID=A0A3A3YSD7_9ACTN|nr:hypothetical protein [Vallicoccus soli]RJK94261.1 hypothetical protein D5H78_14835 [Vallicoccus soli]
MVTDRDVERLERADRVELVALLALLGAAVVLAVATLAAGGGWVAAVPAALVLWQLALLRRRPTRRARSAAALARWDDARVRATVCSGQDEVAAVRTVRRADPDLSLQDAVRLVRASRSAQP